MRFHAQLQKCFAPSVGVVCNGIVHKEAIVAPPVCVVIHWIIAILIRRSIKGNPFLLSASCATVRSMCIFAASSLIL